MASRDTISVGLEKGLLDQAPAVDFVGDPRAGGIAVFTGVTRTQSGERETLKLSYDAYPEMAESEIRVIANEVLERMDVCRVYVRHRLGVVPAGEASVLIAVSAPHRVAAFEGCRYLIDELKKRVPIWKKEHFSDGTEEWVEGGAGP